MVGVCIMISCACIQAARISALRIVFLLSLVGCQSYQTVEQVADQDELNRYLQHLWKKIEIITDVRYPDMQQLVHKQSRIEVDMYINRNGELIRVDVVQGSGDAKLDTALLDVLHFAAPHPPLPPELQVNVLKINKSWMFVPAN